MDKIMTNTNKNLKGSRAKRIFMKTIFLCICSAFVIPFIVWIGYNIGEFLAYFIDQCSYFFNGFYDIFIAPFFASDEDQSMWVNFIRLCPYVAIGSFLCVCGGYIGIIIGSLVMFYGVLSHVTAIFICLPILLVLIIFKVFFCN
jgi:hypothetical protein